MTDKHKKKKAVAKIPVWGIVMAVVAVLVVAVILVVQLSQPKATGLPNEITASETMELKEQGAFILDVREPDEWEQAHIEGAVHIPLGELTSRLSEVPSDKPVVVVCRSGRRSAQGRDILLGAGFSQVTSMSGGLIDWQAQGLPVVTGP